MNQKLDRELKDKRIGQVDHKEKSHSGGTMNALSDFCMACLSLSGALGDAKISFFNKDDSKRENFFLKNFPVRIRVSRLKSMVDNVYRLAIKRSIMRALERSGLINEREGG
ncbi:hypothetical protein [Chromobacterium haemolyticum]|uniref:hypothetical protein n=1 Tax=Chromobacterium haemolyticum TaxID=394935 RepID=UPI0013B3FE59|nr:hypothetical protein [Chromobacterium haemolyticum]